MEVLAAAELEAAERVVMRWDSTASAGGSAAGDERAMLFDGRRLRGGGAVPAGGRRHLSPRAPLSAGAARAAMQVAMARLEDELRHVLAARTLDLEIEALAGLTSLSMAGGRRNSDATDAAGGDEDGAGAGGFGRARRRRRRRSIRVVAASCRLLRGPPPPLHRRRAGARPWAVRRNDEEKRKHGNATELQWRVTLFVSCLSQKHVLVCAELIRFRCTNM
jgi:hypothetical protein